MCGSRIALISIDKSIVIIFLALFFTAWGLTYVADAIIVFHGVLLVFGLYLIAISLYFSHFLPNKASKWPVCKRILISSKVVI